MSTRGPLWLRMGVGDRLDHSATEDHKTMPNDVITSYRMFSSIRFLRSSYCPRRLHTSARLHNLAEKYADKLQKRAAEQGKTVDELRSSLKAKQRPTLVAPEAAKFIEKTKLASGPLRSPELARKDNSPVKPLAEIMDLSKILATPHTAAQVAALWNTYHSTRGMLSASIPLSTYDALLASARQFPAFVLPLPRDVPASELSDKADGADVAKRAHEFHFMQWAFHGAPPPPTMDPLSSILSPPPNPPPQSVNPASSTILFTPLMEYKLHQTFATPALVLTHYTDLAGSHGIVLLRGERTPSSSSVNTGCNPRYILNMQDAHLLSLGVQRFYLAQTAAAAAAGGSNQIERAQLLRTFHERPDEFVWEELLRHTDPTDF
ncbi:ATP11-domain-containing protein [Rickenella mellea]|uniref:ATP11-domain-containing protein n=1 Tax=Rickenella mellea TaxID=50990 RepID=A0A4Y7Q675_9AGAM|nr:ATP11-domain-containing protein [Rickenella mellea]